jgi:hypothetical protein
LSAQAHPDAQDNKQIMVEHSGCKNCSSSFTSTIVDKKMIPLNVWKIARGTGEQKKTLIHILARH